MHVLGSLLLSLILSSSLSAQAYWVYGCIVDEEGFLMENVSVTSSGVENGASNEDGKYDILLHDTATSALVFSAPGYKDVLRSASPTPQGTLVNVQMQPEVQTYRVYGRVTDARGNPLPGATVLPQNSRSAAVTDSEGRYDLPLRENREVAIRFSFIGFDAVTKKVIPTVTGARLDVILRAGVALGQAEVEADGTRSSPVQKIDPRIASRVPSVRGTVEDLLIQAPVNFTSELSSAYNVRGGSFDENLVYVNGIEVYRPFLVRAGQQEGLSFPNPDMIQSIRFSAGGFESKYGDRMSSVLDINYRRPQGFAGRASVSLLGAQFQAEDVSTTGAGPTTWACATATTATCSVALTNRVNTAQSTPTCRLMSPTTRTVMDLGSCRLWRRRRKTSINSSRKPVRPTSAPSMRRCVLTVYFDGQEVTQYRTGFAALAADRVTPHLARDASSALPSAPTKRRPLTSWGATSSASLSAIRDRTPLEMPSDFKVSGTSSTTPATTCRRRFCRAVPRAHLPGTKRPTSRNGASRCGTKSSTISSTNGSWWTAQATSSPILKMSSAMTDARTARSSRSCFKTWCAQTTAPPRAA